MGESVWVANALTDIESVYPFSTDVSRKILAEPPGTNADLLRSLQLLTSQAKKGGRVVDSDLISAELTLEKVTKPSEPPPHFFSNEFALVSDEVRAILEQFDLGQTAFKQVTLVNPFAKTRHANYNILNVCELKATVDVATSSNLYKRGHLDSYTFNPPKDDAVCVNRTALEGVDLWIDLKIFGALFVSERLHAALTKAKLFTRPKFVRCKVSWTRLTPAQQQEDLMAIGLFHQSAPPYGGFEAKPLDHEQEALLERFKTWRKTTAESRKLAWRVSGGPLTANDEYTFALDEALLPKKMRILRGPADWDFCGQMGVHQAVSEGFKDLIEGIEPGVHQFIPFDLFDKDGQKINRNTYFWRVRQFLDAINPEPGGVEPLGRVPNHMWTMVPGRKNLAVYKDRIKGHAAWYDARFINYLFVSDEVVEGLKARNMTGWRAFDTWREV